MNPIREPFRDGRRRAAIVAAVLALSCAGVLALATARGSGRSRAAFDERAFHRPVIEQFAGELPRVDLANYRSATSPGYHLLLALVHRYVSADDRALRCAGAAFTVLLVGVLGWALGRRLPAGTAVAAGLPMVASLYVVSSGAWFLPDNLGWLTVLLALLLAFRPRLDRATYAAATVVLVAAVFVRQVNLWTWGPLLVAAMLRPADAEPPPSSGSLRQHASGGRNRRLLGMALAGVPAVVVLGWLVVLWGGLAPPGFRAGAAPGADASAAGSLHVGPNPAVPAMVLAVLGATGVFFVGFAWPALYAERTMGRRLAPPLLTGLILGAAAALVVPTNWDPAVGRSSGLWNVSNAFPVVAGRSTLIVALASAGGAVVAAGFLALSRRDRWVWLAAWLCFTAAQTANAMAWQRYYEPFCLLMLAVAAGRAGKPNDALLPRWAAAGPVALAALLGVVTWWSLKPAGPAP